jgi:Leucine-rich repeat (LRR) protein
LQLREIDEDDYHVIDRILNALWKDERNEFKARLDVVKKMVGINKSNKYRRVFRIQLPKSVTSLPENLVGLDALEILDLSNNEIEEIPSWLGKLTNLKELDF